MRPAISCNFAPNTVAIATIGASKTPASCASSTSLEGSFAI
jgi:hypothetical protein